MTKKDYQLIADETVHMLVSLTNDNSRFSVYKFLSYIAKEYNEWMGGNITVRDESE